MHLCLSVKCESSSERDTGHPGHRKVHRDVTCIGNKRGEEREFNVWHNQFH